MSAIWSRSVIVVWILGLVAVIGSGCSGAKPSREAAIGMKEVSLSSGNDLKGDGPGVAAGTRVTVTEEQGDTVRVRTQDGKEYWCRRIATCTLEELGRRQANEQVPDGITFMGLGDGGGYRMYGQVQIRNGRVAIVPGQGLWFDPTVCEGTNSVEVAGTKVAPRVDAIFFVTENGLVELPAWPRNR